MNAVIYVPAYHPRDAEFAHDCLAYAASWDLYAIVLRDVSTVVHMIRCGWAPMAIVACRQHAIQGWPFVVVGEARTRRIRLASVTRLYASNAGPLRNAEPARFKMAERASWPSRPLRRDDGGFAEQFLAARLLRSRHMGDT